MVVGVFLGQSFPLTGTRCTSSRSHKCPEMGGGGGGGGGG